MLSNTNSDIELIKNYLSGDDSSLEILILRYLKPIYNFALCYVKNPQEAEDITQETFVKVWKNLKKFDQEKSFKTWVFAIAKNTAMDYLKKKKHIPFSQFEDENEENVIAETLADSAPLPDKIFEKAETEKMLNEAIKKLSPIYQEVLLLYYNDHFNFREISEILKESIDTVKSRQRRGISKLREILEISTAL